MTPQNSPTPESLAIEQAENPLLSLEAEAAAVDAGMVAAPLENTAQAEADAARNTAQEIAELTTILQMASSLFFPLFPSLQTVYTHETCASLAGALVPVMVKRGWSVAGLTAGWGEEIALAIVAIPIGIATRDAVKADIAANEAKAKADKAKAEGVIQPEIAPLVAEQYQPAANEPLIAARG